MTTIVEQLINGITLGGMYALIALGYTLVYGILLMINFAHSELFMVGAYVGLGTLLVLTDDGVISGIVAKAPIFSFLVPAQAFFTGGTVGMICLFLIIFLVSMTVVGLMGVIIERFAYRPLRHAPRLAPLISAVGVSIFLQNAVLLWIDSKQIPFPNPMGISVAFTFLGVQVSTLKVFIVATAIILMVCLDLYVGRSRMGKAMRATSQDREAAGLMGIDINLAIMLAFFIGPALGAVAGVFYGMYYGSIVFNMGFIPGMKAFTAAVIGGIGNLRGAMLGGFVLGIVESLAAGFLSSGYKDVIAFLVLILVLIFRPGGLLGESVVEKV
ncbi:MAG: branched-chain amino acid ABC transporter permease [Coriobacteriia bacterium]|nr:branched-chain amino acid ABC transporter permease [Coriobacteriia bacterium]